jgi:hypothetical protein
MTALPQRFAGVVLTLSTIFIIDLNQITGPAPVVATADVGGRARTL